MTTPEEPTIPIGTSGAKFTSSQFDRLCNLATDYLHDTNKYKGLSEEELALLELFDRPPAIDTNEHMQKPSQLQSLTDQANAEIIAGGDASPSHKKRTFEKLAELRKNAQRRGQTAQRRSISSI